MPTGRHVRDFEHRRVELHDLIEANDSGVELFRASGTKELPAMVVRVVRDVQDRLAAEDD